MNFFAVAGFGKSAVVPALREAPFDKFVQPRSVFVPLGLSEIPSSSGCGKNYWYINSNLKRYGSILDMLEVL